MKVLTIKQPYASLIAAGIKEYEFRTWSTKFRGTLLIHAGKSIDKDAMKKFKKYDLEYPTGCIVAKVTLTDCIKMDDEFKRFLKEKDYFVYSGTIDHLDWEGYGFQLENIQKIKPIQVNGKLGLWEYDFQ